MTSPAFSVCVYCGSRPGLDPAYADAASRVGRWIAKHDGQLVYSGGRSGLMGIAADAALQAGAQVVGVIPESLVDKEWAHRGCTELHIVQTMHQRKHLMAERADIFLALPGGIGTLEELFEVWTWRQLGYHNKPVGILNTGGYYNSLLEFLHRSVQQEFLGDWQRALVRTSEDPERLLFELVQAAGFAPAARLDLI
jgi:uncharacterized protein (TIGR00730 family)